MNGIISARLGRITSVSGAELTATLDSMEHPATRVGALLKVPLAYGDIIVVITELRERAGPEGRAEAVLAFLGSIGQAADASPQFDLGIPRHPALGADIVAITRSDYAAIYARPAAANIRVGALWSDPAQPAFVAIDALLARHFAVFGMTGAGKSSAVILILSAILAGHANAHIVVIDPHNEYSAAFGELAEAIDVDNLELPLWLLDAEEAVEILVRGGTMREQESQEIILKDAMLRARRQGAGDSATIAITVDTPVPFRISDLIRFIDEAMGRLDNPDNAAPYLRLTNRIKSLRDDRRFAFMFGDQLVLRDTLARIVGRLLRMPAGGKPVAVIDLSGVPSEIADVVVSVVCRVTFDFCRASPDRNSPPVLLVCEEAHRYVPADERVGFAATTRAITRIAKEGRKYGLGLALVSQRPSELSPAALSQCGTIFAMRLGSELDQRFVANAVSQTAQAILPVLPNLPTQHAVVSGEAVTLPMRIRFDELAPERRPRSQNPRFHEMWQRDAADLELVEEHLRRWREQQRNR